MKVKTEHGNLKHPAVTHFDRRSTTYDRDDLHHRLISLLVGGADIQSGYRVLDIATGTGLLAIEAARQVGPTGNVVAIDISPGMLAEARRKINDAGLRNVEFVLGDAEQLACEEATFDRVFCSSALVLMSDISCALRNWFKFLKPGGVIAFDAPSRPFGVAEVVAEIAAKHGIQLAYSEVAETIVKCRDLLEDTGFEVIDVRTEMVSAGRLELERAIAFWDERLDHPAWIALSQTESTTRDRLRSEFVDRMRANAVGGCVSNDIALNVAFGRKPMRDRQLREFKTP